MATLHVLDLALDMDVASEGDGVMEALMAVNHQWLGHYARLHATFSVEPALLERNSLWLNAFFQKQRMLTSPTSKQAQHLVTKHQQAVAEKLRSVPQPHTESEFSTMVADPVAVLMFAASVDRCPEQHIEYLLMEAAELLKCPTVRYNANRSGFAGCVFRYLTQYTEPHRRIQCLELLVHLAESDTDATVDACQIAGQGLFWQPHMFIYTLRKRHHDCSVIVELAARLHEIFSNRMPVTSPIQLDDPPRSTIRTAPELGESGRRTTSTSTRQASSVILPSIQASRSGPHSPLRPMHSPTTTISTLYWEAPSPYSPTRLPIARPVTSPAEQVRRATVFSTPKRAAVEGDRFQRCATPNAVEPTRPQTQQNFPYDEPDEAGPRKVRSLDPLDATAKKKIILSENYSWNPETLNSASGFEWWWRTLPEHHASLEPTEKLKAVAKAAVRMHTSGNWQRAIDLYQLALSMAQGGENNDVEFRLRVNLACAYEAEEDLETSKLEFEAALSISPNDTYARFKLGTIIAAMGDFDRAEVELKSVLPVYPEAEKALQQLHEARTIFQRQEEEKRVATAAAKVARRQSSPRTKARPNSDALKHEPAVACPPPTGKPQNSTSYRSSRQATKPTLRVSSPNPTKSKVTQPESPIVPAPPVITSSVATSTEEEISSNLFERILLCCVKHHIEFQTLVRSMDIKGCGLIRLESLVTLLRIIGIELRAEIVIDELQISPAQQESIQGHDFIRYPSLLRVYNEKQINRASQSGASGTSDMMSRLVDLVQQERSFYVHTFAESKADEWLSAGTQMTVLRLQIGDSSPKEAASDDTIHPEATQDGYRSADIDDMNMPSMFLGASPRLQRLNSSRSCELPILSLASLSGAADDANTSMASARMQQKQDQILRAETERVLARKHMHCLKSLRSIAARARKHQEEKYAALQYLRDFAANARQELAPRHESTTSVASDPPIAMELFEQQFARNLASILYAQSVETAVRHIEEMQQLQSLAQQYAAMSQVPTHWLPDADISTTLANDTQS